MVGGAGRFAPLCAKGQPRLVRVVRAAAQLDVVDRGAAAGRVRLHVVELEKRRLPAPPLGAGERAAPVVAPVSVTCSR